MDLFELTKALIDIPSVTGEEGRIGRFLHSHLESLGYSVELQPVEGTRCNVIATTSEPPHIVFATHMDTVPPHIAWSEDEQYIFGRGACDAKGIMAAQIFAAETLRAEGLQTIGLLFTVDEEMGSVGAAVADEHPVASDCHYLINGEPTDSCLAIGTKGSLRLRISVQGRAAHSAYPELGESAIEKLLRILDRIRKSEWPTDDFFGVTTCNIGLIQGGTRPNVIPAAAEAVLQIRLTTGADEVKSLVETALAGDGTVEYLSVHEPVRLLAIEGFEQRVVRFTTDIPYLSRWGRALLLGPGSIFDAHTESERIDKDQLKHAVELYVRLARTLISRRSHVNEPATCYGAKS